MGSFQNRLTKGLYNRAGRFVNILCHVNIFHYAFLKQVADGMVANISTADPKRYGPEIDR